MKFFALPVLVASLLLSACGGGDGGGGSSGPQQPQSTPLTITSGNPPAGVVSLPFGSSAGFTFTASGGKAPYTWTWVAASGSSLPSGLTLSSGGVISGTPTTVGDSQVIVTVSDSASAHIDASYTISVFTGLTITSASVPNGTVGTRYGTPQVVPGPTGPIHAVYFRLTATGGSGGVEWSWAADQNSQLPPGLVCCQAILGGVPPFGHGILFRGIIIGTPTLPGVFHVTITAMQPSTGLQASIDRAITIAPPPPPTVNTTPSPAIGTLNSPYVGYSFTASDGLPPITFAETGALPPGISFVSSGLLSGTPTAAGTFPISVTAMDSVNQVSSPQNFNIQVLSQGFVATASMSNARALHTANLLNNGKVLVLAGMDTNGDLSTGEIFDPVAKTFTASGQLTGARDTHTATTLSDGRVLVVGGFLAGGALSTAEIFNAGGSAATGTGSLHTARGAHTATLLNNGKVLVTGGIDVTGVPSATAELFDPSAGTFTTLPDMSVARAYHTATLLSNGKVLIVGGENVTDDLEASSELFDPVAGTFSASGSMATPRIFHTATLLTNNKVLIVGGVSPSGVLDSVELYDPGTGSFSGAGSMEAPRASQTATLLPGGLVLIAGGVDFNRLPVSTVETFNPAGNVLSRTADLTAVRSGHTATLLNNGQVFVTGGVDSLSSPLASAELYH